MTAAWRSLLAASWVLSAAAAAESPASQGADAPAVASVWARPAMQGRTGAVYMTIQGGRRDDRLVGVQTDVSAGAGLHVSTEDGGVMRMRPVGSIPVPAGKTVRLAPGGFHVMLPDLARGLQAGDSFPVTLLFSAAGKVETSARVRKDGGSGDMGEETPPPMEPPDAR